MSIDDLPILNIAQHGEYPRYINNGAHGTIFAISDDLVIKVPMCIIDYSYTSINEVVEELETESEVQRRLYEGYVSVPKPEGVFKCSIPTACSGRFVPGLIMERLYGLNGMNAYRERIVRWEKLIGMTKAELEKAQLMGFNTDKDSADTGLHNTIYHPEMDKLWLIDFSLWELPTRW